MDDPIAGFHVRLASSDGDDAEFILAAWDSTLPYLASIGAGEMWGDQPFHSERVNDKRSLMLSMEQPGKSMVVVNSGLLRHIVQEISSKLGLQ